MTAQVIHGDCLEVLRGMADDSVDSIVTDPPYGLSFMGKRWDYDVPSSEIWSECLRVLKPGGHLLAFAGTRTQHRMAVRIEDAGFEIRDMIAWVYGCLSDDSEVLTREGWEHYHTARHKEILAYDPQADVYQWERPSRWSEYRVESDTAYRIKSDQTDQIVSRGHRCLVERGGMLAFVPADELAGVERVPYLQSDVFALPQRCGKLLLEAMLRQGKGLAEEVLSERKRQEMPRQRVGGAEKSGVERRIDVLQAKGEVRQPINQIRSVPSGVFRHGPQGRVCDGAPSGGIYAGGEAVVAERVRPSHQPRCDGQQGGELDAVCDERRSQAVRARPTYQTTLATVTPVKYTGLIFCPTVSTGAFVARRNGKVFLTGNSGFPKSLDVSKAIDKAAGAEREVVGSKLGMPGYHLNPHDSDGEAFGHGLSSSTYETRLKSAQITAPATDAARQWQGWGTALKPALEPITVARKPLAGTVSENVLAHGTGALNIDGCRVGDFVNTTPSGVDRRNAALSEAGYRPGAYQMGETTPSGAPGRWPANLIHDGSDEVVALFPQSSGGGFPREVVRSNRGGEFCQRFTDESRPQRVNMGDAGSAARFFYCAKASRKDRNEGCEHMQAKPLHWSSGSQNPGSFQSEGTDKSSQNNHPTVKPTDLMRYLCRLVTPPGGVVLDPFSGSGSTGKAAVLEGFDFIGIEREAQYVEIARARISAVSAQKRLFV